MAGTISSVIILPEEISTIERVVRDAEQIDQTGPLHFRPRYGNEGHDDCAYSNSNPDREADVEPHNCYAVRNRRTDYISDMLTQCEEQDVMQIRLWGEDDEFGLRIPYVTDDGLCKVMDFEFYDARFSLVRPQLKPSLKFFTRFIGSGAYLAAHGYNKMDKHWNLLFKHEDWLDVVLHTGSIAAEKVRKNS